LYFSSAANSGNVTHGTAGTWEGDFVNGGPAGGVLAGAGTLHSFGATTYDVLSSRGSVIVLEWSDPLGASNNDYDLYILNAAGTGVLTASNDFQTGTQDPVEIVACSLLVHQCTRRRRPVRMRPGLPLGVTRALRRYRARTMTIVTAGNTFGHNAAGSAFTPAAT
jgi:hypothetical protein